MLMAKTSVIVVAGGRGERFGGKENKIFAKLEGQPLFLRALQLFVNREDVCQTLLVVSPAEMGQMKAKFGANISFMGVKLVEGGAARWQSVANGLAEVADDAELVAVHDAVRVCLAEQWIDRIFNAAAEKGSAVPVVPVTATLKRVGQDRTIGQTVDRENLYMAQTPQVFAKSILEEAYARLGDGATVEDQVALTDDAAVVAAAVHPVTAVDGDPRNIKITTKGDMSLAGAILKALPQKPVSRRGAFEEAQW